MSRILFHWINLKEFRLDIKRAKRIAIVGHSKEAHRVKKLVEDSRIQSDFAGFIAIDKSDSEIDYIGEIEQITEIIRINRINEVIFCAENISSAQIIRAMLNLAQLDIEYKIAPPESVSIIGSNSIHTSGDWYVVNINSISKPNNKIKKRMFDLGFAIIFLLFLPVTIWFYKRKTQFVKNIFGVLGGRSSWIGYNAKPKNKGNLPTIKPGILNPGDYFAELVLNEEKLNRLNMLYAKDYSITTDTEILFKAWKKLDENPG